MTTEEHPRGDNGIEVTEDWLVEVFRPQRPDPEAFDDSVREAIEERRDSPVAKPPFSDNPWLRRAAALAPFAPVPSGSAKGVLWLLSLPVLLLVGSAAAFTSGLRAAHRDTDHDQSAPTESDRMKAKKRAGILELTIQFAPALAMLLPAITGSLWVRDATMLVIVVAMFAFVLQLRGSDASADQVARIGSSLLMTTFMAGFLWIQSMPIQAVGSAFGMEASAAVLGIGIIALSLLRLRVAESKAAPRMQAIFAVIWVPVVLGLVTRFQVLDASPEDLRQDVEAFAADTDDLADWREIAAAVETLRALDADSPDLTSIRTAVADAIAHPEANTHPVVWTAAPRMGLLDEDLWRGLATHELEEFRMDQLLLSNGELHMTEYNEYQVWMLRATRDLSADDAQRLLDRIGASWPAADDFGSLSDTLLLVHLLDLLERPDLVEARRDQIFEVLTHNWVGERKARFSKIGGFTSDPSKFESSFEESTWVAVELMSRVGAPPSIDLQLLRAYLRHESRGLSWRFDLYKPALVLLEHEIGLPERSWFERLLAERVLIATVLLVLLCILSVRFAANSPGPSAPDEKQSSAC